MLVTGFVVFLAILTLVSDAHVNVFTNPCSTGSGVSVITQTP